MKRDFEELDWGPSESLKDRLLREMESSRNREGEELAASFLRHAMLSLHTARIDAELTQAQLASRLDTTQSAISRTERDFGGKISLERYTSWVRACGFVPRDLSLAPLAVAYEHELEGMREQRQPVRISIDFPGSLLTGNYNFMIDEVPLNMNLDLWCHKTDWPDYKPIEVSRSLLPINAGTVSASAEVSINLETSARQGEAA